MYLVIHFVKENKYSIIHDQKNKLKNCKVANVRDDNGNWVKGKIEL